jgi:hypothetical protein
MVPFGPLLSYGPDFPDYFRRVTAYTDKILKGAKPADLPVEQPTRFKLTINLGAGLGHSALAVGQRQLSDRIAILSLRRCPFRTLLRAAMTEERMAAIHLLLATTVTFVFWSEPDIEYVLKMAEGTPTPTQKRA